MTRKKRLGVVGVIVAVLTVGAVGAYAAFDATVTNGVNNIRIKSSTSTWSTQSNTFVPVTGATFDMAVPNNQMKTFIAEFSAESWCDGADAGWCAIRILIDGVEMTPAVGSDFAFDSDGAGNDKWESHSMTRYVADVGPGLHTFSVEAMSTNTDTFFFLDDWTFMVTKASQK